MFHHLKEVPLDAILSVVDEFKQDSHAEKINLTIGIYADNQGNPTIFEAVQIAEDRIHKEKIPKNYFPIKGPQQTLEKIMHHVLGEQHDSVIVSYGSGGTGSLRLAAEIINLTGLKQRIWIGDPTFEAHTILFHHCDFETLHYPWLDNRNKMAFDNLMVSLNERSKPNDWVLLQGSCHNPTGVDMTITQWNTLFKTMQSLQLKPLFDVSYHGLAIDTETDIQPVRNAFKFFDEVVVCYSFSKIMGLYNERCGAVMIKAPKPLMKILDSNVQRMSRLLFSNPPAHGIRIIDHVLSDPTLYYLWQNELATYTQRLKNMRTLFTNKLSGSSLSFDHVESGRGMFSLTHLSQDHLLALRRDFGIYLLNNSRMNIAGINQGNIDRIAKAIYQVIG